MINQPYWRFTCITWMLSGDTIYLGSPLHEYSPLWKNGTKAQLKEYVVCPLNGFGQTLKEILYRLK